MAETLDAIGNLGSGDINIDTGGLGSAIFTIILVIFLLVIVFGTMGAIAYIMSTYKHKLPVMELTRTGVPKFRSVRAREMKNEHGRPYKYKLMKGKNVFAPLLEGNYSFYMKNLKGEYIPTTLENLKDGLSMTPSSIDFWAANQIKESNEIYTKQSFWDKHAGTVINALTLVIFIIGVMMIVSEMKGIVSGLNNVAGNFREGKVILQSPSGK